MAEFQKLTMEIQADATKADSAISRLKSILEGLKASLGGVSTNKLKELTVPSKAATDINNIGTASSGASMNIRSLAADMKKLSQVGFEMDTLAEMSERHIQSCTCQYLPSFMPAGLLRLDFLSQCRQL